MKKILCIVALLLTTSVFAGEGHGYNYKSLTPQPKTKIGGYGLLHYSFSKIESQRAEKGLSLDHFVLFFSHAWSKQLWFESEVAIENNFIEGGTESGELSVEEAVLTYAFFDYRLKIQAGVFLAPITYTNKNHHPEDFLGARRSNYAQFVVPTSLFDNGAAIQWSILPNLNVTAMVMGGIDLDKADLADEGLGSGRQKGFNTEARNLNYILASHWESHFGLLAGGSVSLNLDGDSLGADQELSSSILEGYVKFENHRFFFLGEAGIVFLDEGLIAGNRIHGFHVDFGVNVLSSQTQHKLFAWGNIDTYQIGTSSRTTSYSFGIDYRPLDLITYKADYTIEKTGNENTKRFHLAVGYTF